MIGVLFFILSKFIKNIVIRSNLETIEFKIKFAGKIN